MHDLHNTTAYAQVPFDGTGYSDAVCHPGHENKDSAGRAGLPLYRCYTGPRGGTNAVALQTLKLARRSQRFNWTLGVINVILEWSKGMSRCVCYDRQ